MLIAQLSDLHICRASDTVFGGRDSAQSLARCVQAVNALRPRPDFVMLSGDLVNTGHIDEYMRLESILASLEARYYLMPGNHDERATLRSVFAGHGYLGRSGPIQYVIEHAGWRTVTLDTVVPGAEHGELDAPRLAWLEATLAQQPQQPTIVFMHHPAFATGIVDMDGGRVREPGFWPLLARHPQVKRVSCGHVHRAVFTQRGALPVCIAPSTAATLGLQLDAAVALQVTDEPVGFLLHNTVDQEVLTHCVWVPST
jgi:3',5'-cyclic-AMP phosphodiesterase